MPQRLLVVSARGVEDEVYPSVVIDTDYVPRVGERSKIQFGDKFQYILSFNVLKIISILTCDDSSVLTEVVVYADDITRWDLPEGGEMPKTIRRLKRE